MRQLAPPRIVIAAALAWALAGPALATEDVPGLSASASRPVVPLLIRNALAPLVRLEIDVGTEDPSDQFPRYEVRLTSLSFVLDGTDDPADLASLQIVSTAADDRLRLSRSHVGDDRTGLLAHPIARLGEAAAPARSLTFRLDAPLLAGPNYFWLSATVRPGANLLHQVEATCTAVGTSAGWLTAPDRTPNTRQRLGIALRKGGDDGVDTYGIPSLTTSGKGTLLSVYDMRWNYPGHDLQDHITTGLSRSSNGGQTWEPMRNIMDMGRYGGLPPELNGCSDPGIIVDRQSGDIYVFSCWMHGNAGHHQWKGSGSAPGYEIGVAPQLLVVHSSDDGRTWSKPENLTRVLKPEAWWLLAPAPQHGIQLADGTLVMPMEIRDAKGWFCSTVMSSRDHGAHWTLGAGTVADAGEPSAAELGDGSIMLNARNQGENDTTFYRLVYTTRDLGRTWQEHPTNANTLIEPQCNGAILRADYLDDGRKKHVLLFSNPHQHQRRQRHHQTIQVSFDDGKMWPRDHDCLLDEQLGWGYPSMTQIDGRRIGIVYGGSQADIVFQEISLDELLHP